MPRVVTLESVGSDLERELREAGVPDENASELADLAKEIEALPEVKPRRSWLRDAKGRLLERFDQDGSPEPVDPSDAKKD